MFQPHAQIASSSACAVAAVVPVAQLVVSADVFAVTSRTPVVRLPENSLIARAIDPVPLDGPTVTEVGSLPFAILYQR